MFDRNRLRLPGRYAVLTATLLHAAAAVACFPAPDAKPTHDVRELQLRARSVEPSIVHVIGGYAFYIATDDFLQILVKDRRALEKPNDLADVLKSKLPLAEDLNTYELVSALIPEIEADDYAKRSDRFLRHRQRWGRADMELTYAITALLEQKKVAVVDLSRGDALTKIKVDKYSEICHGGRRFSTLDGKELLDVGDWIS